MKPFPTPGLGTKRSTPYDTRVLRWMNSAALARLLALHKAAQPFPTEDELAGYVSALTVDKGGRYVVSGYDDGGLNPGKFRVTHEWLSRTALEVARWAFIHEDSETFLERSARGGRMSKRRPTLSNDQIESVSHLSIRKAAEALGVSVTTINNYRRRLRTQALTGVEALMDNTIEPTSADIDELLNAPTDDELAADQALRSAATLNDYGNLFADILDASYSEPKRASIESIERRFDELRGHEPAQARTADFLEGIAL